MKYRIEKRKMKVGRFDVCGVFFLLCGYTLSRQILHVLYHGCGPLLPLSAGLCSCNHLLNDVIKRIY